MREAEIRVGHLQVKECQAAGCHRKPEQVPSQCPQKESTQFTLGFQTSSLQNCKRINCVAYYTSSRKFSQLVDDR